MLEVKTVLNPFGLDEHLKTVNTVFIANIGKSPTGEDHYDYVYAIYEQGSRFSGGVLEHGVIRNHYQYQSSFHLLKEILLDFGQSGCSISEDFVNQLKEEGKL